MHFNKLNHDDSCNIIEMSKFYEVASAQDKELMNQLLAENKFNDAWALLKTISKKIYSKKSSKITYNAKLL
jgi:hypothetical protein